MLKDFTLYLKIENLAVDGIHKKKYKIQPGQKLILGRSKDCNIVLIDENVSRQHAEIFIQNNQLLIKDLGSGNGTFINGAKIETGVVANTQMIVVGGFELTVTKLEESKSDISPDDIVIEEDNQEKVNLPGAPEMEGIANGFSSGKGVETLEVWKNVKTAKGFIELVKYYVLQAKEHHFEFFQKQSFDGEEKNSLIAVGITIVIPAVLGTLIAGGTSLYFLVQMVISMVLGILGFFIACKIFDATRKWMGMEGKYLNYLRFFAIFAVLAFPLNILGIIPVVGIVFSLAGLVVGLYAIYSFYTIFKPVLIRFIAVIILVAIVNMVISFAINFAVGLVVSPPKVEIPEEYNNVIKQMKGQRKELEKAIKEN